LRKFLRYNQSAFVEQALKLPIPMQLSFAFLSRAAERAEDGTIHAFGAGCDRVELAHVPASVAPITLVAKFRCDANEKGQQHELGVDMASPSGGRLHLASERVIVGQGGDGASLSLGATFVATIDAQFETGGEHVFHLSVDGTRVASLPLNVVVGARERAAATAMRLRSEWMSELGLSVEEIAELCDAELYPADADEELANLNALQRMRSSKWNI
jgi:hypothetical protein